MIFIREGKILCEIGKWEKPNETRDNLWNQDKTERDQTELKRRKKINKEKDYGRLRSVNENESKVQKKKKK